MNLIKLSVGVESIEELRQRQIHRLFHVTRTKPKQADAILASGGSMYWVIQRQIMCRQKITGFEAVTVDDIPKCKILLDRQLVPVTPWPRKPFQGWRYLDETPDDIDISTNTPDETPLPAALAIALDHYGVR